MNTLETKATELVELAAGYGIEAEVLTTPNYIKVNFSGNLYSRISLTDTGKVRVESLEWTPARSERVSLKALPEYIAYLASTRA
jgi:hypothetical protein